jgi:predicted NAD/FAD-binding protein
MNDLQRLPTEKHGHLFATLNPLFPPSPKHVLGRYSYAHPVLSADAVRAQRRLAQLNARATESGRHRAFAGAWARYGFHEDGFAAGLRAAAVLPGVKLPFAIADADVERGEPRAGAMARLFDVLDAVRAFVVFLVGRVLVVLIRAVKPVERKVD